MAILTLNSISLEDPVYDADRNLSGTKIFLAPAFFSNIGQQFTPNVTKPALAYLIDIKDDTPVSTDIPLVLNIPTPT